MNQKQCQECKDGEHDNYDEDVQLVVVRDPQTQKTHRRCYMCKDHRIMYDMDGYDVNVIERKT